MAYHPAHYNQIFEEMRKRFGDTWYQSIAPVWWNIWRRQIKELFFDQDILIKEMIAGLDEAAEKRKWPAGTVFFQRLQMVCLKNRREARPTMEINRGMQPLSELIKK